MPQLIFGRKRQIRFNSDGQFYEALGFLAKNNGTTSIHWEHNEDQGAWGSEGRIHCYRNIAAFPIYFSRAFTAGAGGKIIHRINCNAYIEYINLNHGFVLGGIQTVPNILATIPPAFVADFDRGLRL